MNSRLLRALIGAVVGFMLFAAVAAVAQHTYYSVMPGNWFLNYYYIHVDDAEIGGEVPVTLCRKTRYSDFKLNATRTFLYVQVNGQRVQTADYDLSPTIEARSNPCTVIPISTMRQPQKAGTYQICTTGYFFVEGNRKTIKPYCSNAYRLNATTESIRDEIERLQQRIEDLEQQLSALPGESTPTVANGSVTPVRPAGAAPRSASATSTTSSQQAQQTAPTQATPPSAPVPANPVTRLLNGIQAITGGL